MTGEFILLSVLIGTAFFIVLFSLFGIQNSDWETNENKEDRWFARWTRWTRIPTSLELEIPVTSGNHSGKYPLTGGRLGGTRRELPAGGAGEPGEGQEFDGNKTIFLGPDEASDMKTTGKYDVSRLPLEVRNIVLNKKSPSLPSIDDSWDTQSRRITRDFRSPSLSAPREKLSHLETHFDGCDTVVELGEHWSVQFEEWQRRHAHLREKSRTRLAQFKDYKK